MTDSTARNSWNRVGTVASAALSDARLQSHHAAQVVVSAAISYIDPRPDDSHTNLEWLPAVDALATNPITAAPGGGVRFALQISTLRLLHLRDGTEQAALELHGHTVEDVVRWLTGRVSATGLDPARLTQRKHYEIPPHPVARGSAFNLGDGATFAELAAWYRNAWWLESAVSEHEPAVSDIRCWPHHFDLAMLLTEGEGRTIGIGLSPGDESYDEPYFYVGPYPYPPNERLRPLARGHWHTRGWMAAVLTATELLAAEDQRSTTLEFARDAVNAAREARR